MAIAGLTDRGAAFPQIGTLRKGDKKVDERRPGKDLDHFRFDCDDPDALAAFHEAYGDKPRAINVYLPYATVEENFGAWLEHWVAGGLKRRCDGQACILRQNGSGRYDQTPSACACQTLPADSKERCKPVGRLQVIIPELKRLAYVSVLTTSLHDIKNLSSQMTALELSIGTLRGIPLVLRRSPVEISMPGQDGKRVRREKWLLSIEAAPRWVGLQLQSMERAALTGAGFTAPMLAAPPVERLALPNGISMDAASGEVIDDEDEAPAPPVEIVDAPPARDLNPVKALRDEIRQLGGDPGKIAPAALLEMSGDEFGAYTARLLRQRDDLRAAPETQQAA